MAITMPGQRAKTEPAEMRQLVADLLGVPVPKDFEAFKRLIEARDIEGKRYMNTLAAHSPELKEVMEAGGEGADSIYKEKGQHALHLRFLSEHVKLQKDMDDTKAFKQKELAKAKENLAEEKESHNRTKIKLNSELDAEKALNASLTKTVDDLKNEIGRKNGNKGKQAAGEVALLNARIEELEKLIKEAMGGNRTPARQQDRSKKAASEKGEQSTGGEDEV